MWILFVVQYYIFGLVRFKDISILNQLDMLRSKHQILVPIFVGWNFVCFHFNNTCKAPVIWQQ